MSAPHGVPGAKLPGGPRGWPLLGNLPSVRSLGMLAFLEQSWRAHGDIFPVNMGRRSVVLAHPDAIRQVLVTNAANYVKGDAYDSLRRVIGGGLLASEGPGWKQRRALLQPVFHRSSIARLTATMVESGRLFFDGLLERVGAQPVEIDIHQEMVQLTLDVVIATLFGRELCGVTELPYEALGASFALASEAGNGIVLPPWVPTPFNRRFHRTMAEVDRAVYQIIAAGRRLGPNQGTLLSMLLDSRDEETGQPLSDQEVRDEVFTMFVAGHETTALTLTWMFTLLYGRPEVVAAMREEVDRVVGDREPTIEDVPKLIYVRQVVDETLRLRGPVGLVARNALEDDVISGVAIPAGTLVLPFFYGTHRHPDFWPDAETFDPGRFSPARSAGRNPFSYVPFSAGKRQCIGNTFSLVEITVLLAQLLRRFEVDIPQSVTEVRPQMMATIRTDRPVRVTLRARQRPPAHSA